MDYSSPTTDSVSSPTSTPASTPTNARITSAGPPGVRVWEPEPFDYPEPGAFSLDSNMPNMSAKVAPHLVDLKRPNHLPYNHTYYVVVVGAQVGITDIEPFAQLCVDAVEGGSFKMFFRWDIAAEYYAVALDAKRVRIRPCIDSRASPEVLNHIPTRDAPSTALSSSRRSSGPAQLPGHTEDVFTAPQAAMLPRVHPPAVPIVAATGQKGDAIYISSTTTTPEKPGRSGGSRGRESTASRNTSATTIPQETPKLVPTASPTGVPTPAVQDARLGQSITTASAIPFSNAHPSSLGASQHLPGRSVNPQGSSKRQRSPSLEIISGPSIAPPKRARGGSTTTATTAASAAASASTHPTATTTGPESNHPTAAPSGSATNISATTSKHPTAATMESNPTATLPDNSSTSSVFTVIKAALRLAFRVNTSKSDSRSKSRAARAKSAPL